MPLEPEPKKIGKRRDDRVLIRVHVQVRAVAQDGRQVDEAAETAVVSRFGALLRTRSRLKEGSLLTLKLRSSENPHEFRVVWLGDKQGDGRWEVGVEALQPQEEFWGIRFPSKGPRR